MKIPSATGQFNVFNTESKIMIGVASGLDLPEFPNITETLDGAGINGEIEDPITGMFESQVLKLKFTNLYEDVYDSMNTTIPRLYTILWQQQWLDQESGQTFYKGNKIVLRGKCKNMNPGNVTKGKKGEPEMDIELNYMKHTVDGKELVELDKFNFIYRVNGVDLMAPIRALIF